jgi:hypothetical protein
MVLAGCFTTYVVLDQNSDEHEITPGQGIKYLHRGVPHTTQVQGDLDEKIIFRASAADAAAVDPRSNPTTTFSLSLPAHRLSALSEFTRGQVVRAAMSPSPSSTDDVRFSGSAVVAFTRVRAGTVCLQFHGSTTHQTQEVSASFTTAGGTGDGARLHAAGVIRAVERVPYSRRWQLRLYVRSAARGTARGIPLGCGRPAAPRRADVTATFAGFAISKGAPAAGAALTPEGGVISGGGCHAGGNLYGVFHYAGPTAAEWLTGLFGPGATTEAHKQPVRVGTDAVLLLTKPRNGSYQSKISIQATGTEELTGTTAFFPGISVSC